MIVSIWSGCNNNKLVSKKYIHRHLAVTFIRKWVIQGDFICFKWCTQYCWCNRKRQHDEILWWILYCVWMSKNCYITAMVSQANEDSIKKQHKMSILMTRTTAGNIMIKKSQSVYASHQQQAKALNLDVMWCTEMMWFLLFSSSCKAPLQIMVYVC